MVLPDTPPALVRLELLPLSLQSSFSLARREDSPLLSPLTPPLLPEAAGPSSATAPFCASKDDPPRRPPPLLAFAWLLPLPLLLLQVPQLLWPALLLLLSLLIAPSDCEGATPGGVDWLFMHWLLLDVLLLRLPTMSASGPPTPQGWPPEISWLSLRGGPGFRNKAMPASWDGFRGSS